tara:strand:+ start:341 stop:868 length:528 start_codon:yes stop_codon:yes gene_type:complete
MKSYIKQISEVFPNKKYTNESFFNDFPNLKDKEESLLKVGVTSRYIIEKNVTASDLAVDAANKMFNEDKINRDEIDFLIFCSTEFDHYTPTTAAILQSRLQLKNSIGAIDVVSSCTGFSHSLSIAKGMIEGNGCKNVLLLCVSTLTKTFHKKDANSHFLFGDAATAILVSSRDTA